MSLWAMASPLGSVPDEPAHMVKAASTVRGDIAGVKSVPVPSEVAVTVPQFVAHSYNYVCFVFQPDVTADCQEPLGGDPWKSVHVPTSAGGNSPVAYYPAGLPTLFLSGDVGLYAMRIFNAVACAALLGLMFMSIRQLDRSYWATAAAVVGITPMVLYLGGSTNPNSIEVAAAGALFGILVATMRTPSPGALIWERAGGVAVSAVLLTNSRSIGLLWTVVIVLASVLLARRDIIRELARRTATWVALSVSAVGAIFSFWWYTRPNDLEPARSFEGAGMSFRYGFETMIDRTFDYASGWVGYFGWLDRSAPTVTYIVWSVAIGALLLGGVVYGRGMTRTVLLVLAALAVLTPAVVQGSLMEEFGFIWQGRYMLAMILCLIVAAGITLDDAFPCPPIPRVLTGVRTIVILVAAAHLATFIWVLRRYVVGLGTWVEMVLRPQWQPPFGTIGLSLLFALSLVCAASVVLRTLTTTSFKPRLPLDVRASREQASE